MLKIDGSYKEAGGQILRTATGLSALTKKPAKIFNIRKGRPTPGLKPQHLKGVEAVAKLCNAQTKGTKIKSTNIEFYPQELSHKSLNINIGTAGSITLLLQSLLIPSTKTKKEITFNIIGGTSVKWSPTINYFQNIFCYYLQKMNVNIETQIIKFGFYPKGDGKVKVTIHPGKIKPVNFTERGKLKSITSISIASKNLEKSKVNKRQIKGVKEIMEINKENMNYVNSLSTGTSIFISSNYSNCRLGNDNLGEQGKPAQQVGKECALQLKKEMNTNTCLDKYMQDQIIPYMAIAVKNNNKEMKIKTSEITNHTKTNIWATEKFLPVKFQIKKENKGNLITCTPE